MVKNKQRLDDRAPVSQSHHSPGVRSGLSVRSPGGRAAILLLLMLILLAWVSPVAAAGPLVVDLADVFSASEESQLTSDLTNLGAQNQMDLVLVTTNDTDGKSARDYADDYFDYNGYGVGPDYNGILLLIDFDNREVYISTSGSGIRYLTDARINTILDAIYQDVGNEEYMKAAQTYLEMLSGYLKTGIPSDQYNEPEKEPNRLTLFDGIFGFLVSGLSGLGFAGSIRKKYKGKNQTSVFDFRSNSLVNFALVGDTLLNSRTTSRIRPRPTTTTSVGRSSSGRSTTHTSSSGRSHGGGGRRF